MAPPGIDVAAFADPDTASLAPLGSALSGWLLEQADELESFRNHEHGPVENEIVRERTFQQLLWTAGWTRLGWPRDFGGLGGTAMHRAVVYEGLWAGGYVLPEGMQAVEVMCPLMAT